MPLEIIRNDITAMRVDAIVNAANSRLEPGGGVCGAIHKAAGPRLAAACRALGGCPTGDAKITRGYNLAAKYVIHTVGPVWQDGLHGERELLSACYRNALNLARHHRCKSIAFPLISSGLYGCPKDQALQIATDAIGKWLLAPDNDADMQVCLVVFDKSAFRISSKLYTGIAEYISDHYADARSDGRRRLHEATWRHNEPDWLEINAPTSESAGDDAFEEAPAPMHWDSFAEASASMYEESFAQAPDFSFAPAPASLADALGMIDESFSEMLLRKIGEKGISDSQCYKKANIDRKLFSKIRSDKGYKPSKPTVLAFAIALELPLSETRDMLQKAGFALSRSNKFDIIVEYFIRMGNYNIFEINEALFAFDQVPLG